VTQLDFNIIIWVEVVGGACGRQNARMGYHFN